MSERRMFAKSIVMSDAFQDMGKSTQNLYFILGMVADDDGFVNAPRSVMRMCGAADDDLKVLVAKKFVIPFDSGVIAIKHWRINNSLRSDRYNSTNYKEEMATLEIDENGAYRQTETINENDGIPATEMMVTNNSSDGIPPTEFTVTNNSNDGIPSIGKDSIGKDSLNNNARFDEFWSLYPKKADKKKARAVFLKLDPDDTLFTTIINAVKEQSRSEQWQRGFVPNPTTWLNGERWNDDLPKSKPNPKAGQYITREAIAKDTFGLDYLKEVGG